MTRLVTAGDRFLRLVVLRVWRDGKNYRAEVRCDCGAERVVLCSNLVNGHTRSCGCYRREHPSGVTHGQTDSPEYHSWRSMQQRCYCRRSINFANYGGRGVTVCVRWRESFEAFLADMGFRPSLDYSLDRVDNEGSYTCGKCDECIAKGAPMNCRWADRRAQARNTRRNIWITIGGVQRLAADVCREHGVSKQTFSNRLDAGWTRKAAATTPPDPARVARGRALRNAVLARRTEAA